MVMGTSPVCKSMLAAMLVHAQESSWVAVDIEGVPYHEQDSAIS
jgi:hypothetical protein